MFGKEDRFGEIAAAALLLYLCAVLLAQLSYVFDPGHFHEEERLLFAYHRLGDAQLFDGDYIASFVAAFRQPLLYDAVTRLWIWSGGDLALLHRLIPAACWVAFLVGIAVAALRLDGLAGGRVTAVSAVAFAATQPIYLYQITSALPHAFAFALLAWSLVALLRGSTAGLALLTLLSGLLYPAVAPLTGLLLAWQVVSTLRRGRLRRPAHVGSFALLAVVGGATIWLVLAYLRGPETFGAPLAPMQRSDLFPENGPEGRHFYAVFHPLAYVFGRFAGQFRSVDAVAALGVLIVLLVAAVYGLATLPKGSAGRRPLTAFIVLAAFLGGAIYLLKPYLSYRFLLYPAFTLLPLLAAAGLQQACARLRPLARFSAAATIIITGLFLVSFDSFSSKKLGYELHLGKAESGILAFAAAQPPDRLFAVWPGSPLELMPYVARRPLFLMKKAHYPTYEGHLLKMRARMNALIDAYLATDAAALRDLHCQWRVDYLVVDKAHFAPGGERPTYFAPFDARIAEIWQSHRPEDFLLQHPDPEAVTLESADYVVMDLAVLAGDAGCAAVPAVAEAD